ncbi:MAG TPA: pitrilysin family protein [Rhodocyclaceae bacterium]|nr:pitrilysin family protein [Rhodocyclaceae bacterium]
MKRFALTLIAALAAPLALAGVEIQQWTTPNGARVLFVETRALPILDVKIDFAAGSMFDPAGKSGVAALTRGILDLGAGVLDENAIADRLADLGAGIGGGADTDRASVSLRTLVAPERRKPALELLAMVVSEPRFEPAVIEREQARTIAGLKEALTLPGSVAGKAFWSALYPSHPYGQQATPESVGSVSRADLQAFYQRYYTARNANLTIVGAISRAEAEKIAADLTTRLPAGEPAPLPEAPKIPKGELQKLEHPATQAHIYIGLPAIERGHPDTYALLVGNYSLGGGGFVSRLMKEVRDKRGYAYNVHSGFVRMRQAGPFQINLQTKRAQANEAMKLSRSILEQFVKDGPSEEELAAAKANIVGSFPLGLDSNQKILDSVSAIGFFGLPLDYLARFQQNIAAVTVSDVRRAFARHVRPEQLITIMVAAD